MRFASLGSGSRGNALVVESDATCILIDAGFGPRELSRRLERLGVGVERITAILVTHEHSDHVGGAYACARRFGWQVMMTAGTLAASGDPSPDVGLREIDSHQAFSCADFCIEPFPVPHDAREPVQFVVGNGDRRLGIVTDAGHVTRHMVAMLSRCDALLVECNHDAELLARGSYPAALKRRIAGALGHLDNATAASLLAQVDRSRLRHVVAAHLSEQNNTPAHAVAALAGALDCDPAWIGVASQDAGTPWRDV